MHWYCTQRVDICVLLRLCARGNVFVSELWGRESKAGIGRTNLLTASMQLCLEASIPILHLTARSERNTHMIIFNSTAEPTYRSQVISIRSHCIHRTSSRASNWLLGSRRFVHLMASKQHVAFISSAHELAVYSTELKPSSNPSCISPRTQVRQHQRLSRATKATRSLPHHCSHSVPLVCHLFVRILYFEA
jgi:hypothetical protein